MLKSVAVRGFLALGICCLTMAVASKADTLTPSSFASDTSATFDNVQIYYVDANPSANPWGIVSTCPSGCNANPLGSDSSTPFTTENITFRDSTGSATAGLDVTGGVFTIHSYGSTSLFTSGTDSAPQITGTAKTTLATYTAATDSFCANAACNNGGDPAIVVGLSQIAPDVFTVTSSSLEIAFSLGSGPATSTPEPSSLLMLGSGLFGMLGLGLGKRGFLVG